MNSSLLIVAFALCTPSLHAQDRLMDEANSRIKFTIRNFGLTIEGSLKGLQGRIHFNPEMPSSAVFDVSVDARSIDTGIKLRDDHLRSQPYLHARAFPFIRFVSTRVTPSVNGRFIMTGQLELKGTKLEITFPFTYTEGIFQAQFIVDRRRFGVGSKSLSMSDLVTVVLHVASTSKDLEN